VFGEKGFAAATIPEIAARAGVSPGLTYRYAASKQALFVQVLHEALDRMEAGIAALHDGGHGSPEEQIRAVIDQYHAVLAPHPELPALLADPHMRRVDDEAWADRLAAVAAKAVTAVRGLEPPAEIDVEEFFLLMLSSLFSWFAPTPLALTLGAGPGASPARVERHKAALTDLLTNALQPRS
jgi:AcrR family transcriptional regulator